MLVLGFFQLPSTSQKLILLSSLVVIVSFRSSVPVRKSKLKNQLRKIGAQNRSFKFLYCAGVPKIKVISVGVVMTSDVFSAAELCRVTVEYCFCYGSFHSIIK